MRISSNTIFETGTNLMLQQQDTLIKTQQQLSTGRRVLTPADDPIAAAQVLNVSQSLSLNKQYSINRTTADSSLKLEENVLGSVTSLLQDIHQSAVYSGDATLTDADRKAIAIEVRGKFESLIGLANTTDEKGQYLFSGYQGNTIPFTQSGLNVQYQGDQGQRLSQVGPSRELAVSDSGTDIFERIKDGNGVFATAANPSNTGTGLIDVGTVVTPANLTDNNYEISFTVTAGVTTYDIVNTTTSTTVSSGNAYTKSSAAISFDGIQFGIKGDPADGDKFTVSPSTNKSVFQTIGDFITALESSTTGQPGSTQFSNALSSTLQNVNNSLDSILTKQSAIGAKLQEVDALESVGEDQEIQFESLLSNLQDLDFAKAISDFKRQDLYLQAAQQSYVKIAGLSLFNYI